MASKRRFLFRVLHNDAILMACVISQSTSWLFYALLYRYDMHDPFVPVAWSAVATPLVLWRSIHLWLFVTAAEALTAEVTRVIATGIWSCEVALAYSFGNIRYEPRKVVFPRQIDDDGHVSLLIHRKDPLSFIVLS